MQLEAITELYGSKQIKDRMKAVNMAEQLPESERQSFLLKALRDRANYIAAIAAQLLGEYATWDCGKEMREQFLWLSEDGMKRDGGCHIRSHIAYAMGRIDYTPGIDALKEGIRTVQIEPVGGVPFDTAASLRANCAVSLAALRAPNAVYDIAPLLFDTGENSIQRLVQSIGTPRRIPADVRAKAARALAGTGDAAALIPLSIRLKFPVGEAPEVLQSCMQGIVALEAPDAVHILSPYLGHDNAHLAAYAALMMAQTGSPEVPQLLSTILGELYGDPLKAVILALSSVRTEHARTVLRNVAEDHRFIARMAFIEAVNGSSDPEDRACLLRLAHHNSYPQVREAARAALQKDNSP